MSYQVLARKWRPRTFADLAGQTHVVRALTNALTQNRLHHAWLFTGTRGVGKTTIARILAKALNCEAGIHAEPCGICSACTQIDAGRFVDLIELDAASNTGIDNMRDVLDNAQYAPSSGRFKVYIIDEVHMLSKAAFNSMLKTLEEPPEHVKFILATTDPQKIPITVLSRCLQYNLKQMTPDLITQHLTHILHEEGIHAEMTALQRIARAAQGSMRDALSLLDQAIAYCGTEIPDDAVQHMLGGLDSARLIDLIDALWQQDGASLMEQAAVLAAQGIDFSTALQEISLILHHISLYQLAADALPEDTPERTAIIDLATRIDAQTIQLYYQICLLGRRDLSLAPDESSGFSMTLLRMLAFHPQSHDSAPAPQPKSPIRMKSPDEPRTVSAPQFEVVAPPTASPAFGIAEAIPSLAHTFDAPPTQNTASGADLPTDAASWAQLIERMKLGGQARMLATESELYLSDNDRIHLRLSHNHKHLGESGYQAKLREALRKHFARDIRLEVELCEAVAASPQQQQEASRMQRQSEADAAIQQDPFVQGAITQLDARILSISPSKHST
jgi:DNA polymerase-3 subunit gamma/tau